jgi:hypothetical protein
MDDHTQQTYQDFMLAGKGVIINSATTSPSPTHSNNVEASSYYTKRKKKNTKQLGPIFKAFQGRLEEWMDLDGQMDAVLGSIANLRDRIWWESQKLQQLPSSTAKSKPWEGCGFRTPQLLLLEEDLELALTNDLLQHERMLSAARTLMSSLAQVQEAMGRRLDEWMLMKLEDGYAGVVEGVRLLLEHQVQETYLFLAGELYRKQLLVQKTIDSCHDGLIDKEAIQNLREDEGNPRSVARHCCQNWSPRDKKSQRLVVEALLSRGSITY